MTSHHPVDHSGLVNTNQCKDQQTDQVYVDNYSRKSKLNGEGSKDHIHRGRNKIKQPPQIQRSKSCDHIRLRKGKDSPVKGRAIEIINCLAEC